MTQFPPPQHDIAALIDKHHASLSERPRLHLGASLLGHHCDRWLWMSFRWAVIEKFPGRIKRLFRRGHHEEGWIVADLKAIGVDITHTGRDQARVKFGCHISGSLDGIIESGVPEAPHKRHIAEFKTHSKKSFADLDARGVYLSKPMHFTQMQGYMHGTGIDRALYVAVCKDDDRLYTERVRYDRDHAEKFIARGKAIALSDRIPPPISTDPTWYECKFCPGHDLCFGSKLTKEVNCRTCALSTAKENDTFVCEKYKSEIPAEHQYTGCPGHVLHPDLVPWKFVAGDASDEATYIIDGKPVRNGEGDAFVFSSKELLANASACAEKNPLVMKIRNDMDGEILG